MDFRLYRLPRILVAIIILTASIPLLFYLNFDEVGPFGWGLVVFFDALILLGFLLESFSDWNIGHRGDWIDGRFIPIFWLLVCILGPAIGFFFTGVRSYPPTEADWHWRYIARVIFSVAIPIAAALPMAANLNRKLKPGLVQLAILIGITTLPVATGFNCLRDLQSGPITRREPLNCSLVDATFDVYDCQGLRLSGREINQHATVLTVLPHTGRVLKMTVE
jgi:hypothetical protein